MTVISNNCDYFFSTEDRRKILDFAITRWFDPNFGWYMSKAVKCVVDYCNANLWLDLVYIRVPYQQIPELCDKWFGVVSGYTYMYWMGKDRDDGTIGEDINVIDKYGNTIYWHLVSFWSYKKRKDQHSDQNLLKVWEKWFGFVDNYYPKHKNNETFLKNYKYLVEKGSFFKAWYIIVSKKSAKANTLKKFKQKIKDFRKIIK